MRARVGLVEACDDRELFGLDLWPKQRELLAAVEQGPRLHVLALGRRSGKTLMAAVVCAHACLFRPDLDARMRPGERRYAVAVATNLAQARLLVQAARSIVERSPLLAPMVEAATADELRFTNGTTLAAFPCSSRGGRGWPISTLVMDEAAHFLTETDGFQTAERVWEALVPATAQFGDGARIVLSSTPYGEDGLFASLFAKAAGGELEDAEAHHAATADVNPTVDEAFLRREELRDPDSFRGEYLALFEGSGSAFLDFDRIEVADRGELNPDACHTWVAGLDPAFSRDPFGVAIVGVHPTERGRLVLGAVRSWKPERGVGAFERRVEDVAELCKRYRARAITDQHSAPALIDSLRAKGVAVRAVHTSAQMKTERFQELRTRLYDGTLEVADLSPLLAELRRLRVKHTPGRSAVENPRVGGSHGDVAEALALVVHELQGRGRGRRGRTRTGGYERDYLGDPIRRGRVRGVSDR